MMGMTRYILSLGVQVLQIVMFRFPALLSFDALMHLGLKVVCFGLLLLAFLFLLAFRGICAQ